MTSRFLAITALTLALLVPSESPAQGRPPAAEPLGMVIDLQGAATLTEAGRASRLDMLSYLKAQNEIELSPGAAMTITWYAGSKELRFAGPALLKVRPAGIEVLQGGRPQERTLADEKIAAGKKLPPRIGQAAITMRSVRPAAGAEATASPAITPEQLERLRPTAEAALGDWVLYAMALEQVGRTPEAKSVWKKLSAQRPDDPKLRQLAE